MSEPGGERYGEVRLERGEATWRCAASGAVPAAAVRPRDVDEVVEIVRQAAEAGHALVPVGGGARLGVGNRPRRYDLAVCTRALSSVERHVAEDMTVTVQAGATLAELNQQLGQCGQWLPLDPSLPEDTTIGGLIAADASGPLRNAYGKVRDYLLGLELVNGRGERVCGGGRVVKNVAGYDVPKLLCGSFGTLGIVVSATFKTLPRPRQRSLFVRVFDDTQSACDHAIELSGVGLRAEFLEALSAGACEGVGLECAAALLIGLAGTEAEIAAQSALLRSRCGGELREWDPSKAAGAVRALRNFPAPINEEAIVGRVAVRPAALAELVKRIESEAGDRGLVIELASHAAVGVARCQILGAGDGKQAALFCEWLRLTVRERAGWVVYESMPEDLRGSLDAWGFCGPTLRLMRGIKDVFDPAGIMSPGRFVGGI